MNLPDGVFSLSSLTGGTVPAADACVQDPSGVCCSKFSEPGKEMRGRLPKYHGTPWVLVICVFVTETRIRFPFHHF